MAGGLHSSLPLLTVTDTGLEIPFYVKPRACRSRLVGVFDGMLKVDLAAPPVDGAANKALVRFVAESLNVSRSNIELLSGHKSRRKRVRVRTTTPQCQLEILEGLWLTL